MNHEPVPLLQLDTPLRTFSLIVFLGNAGSSFGAEIIANGFKAPRVYETLDLLLDLKIISDTWEPSDKGGGARRVYRLTPLGQEVYEYLTAIDKLLQ